MRHLRSPLICLALCAFAGNAVPAQVGPSRKQAARELTVATVEAEGAALARSTSNDRRDPRCAEGREMGPAESGDFTIGGMLGGASSLRAGQVGKIWWRPAHASATMPPLDIRGRNLTTLRDTVRFTSTSIAWPTFPGHVTPLSNRQYFFPSGFSVPTAGRWLLVVTSGGNWGCFIVTAV
jgi:hypothetical protein